MNAVALDRISKSFGTRRAVADVSFVIEPGAFVTLLGPSGSGKSTILRIIAGLEQPDHGTVRIDGADVTALPAHQRPSATVFQRYALFPHMDVARNVGFGLRQQGLGREEIRQRVAAALELVSLADRAGAMPHELSGGQEQRVALARALVLRPRVLLLDEPLAALDAGLRQHMQQELLDLQRRTGITFLAVTHDQDEALTMSDQIIVLNEGHLIQHGPAREIFEQPATPFVARFMGAENLLPVTIIGSSAEGTIVRLLDRDLTITAPSVEPPAALVARPETIALAPPDTAHLPAVVTAASYKGATHRITCALPDGTPVVIATPASLPIGDRVHLRIDPNRAWLVPNRHERSVFR